MATDANEMTEEDKMAAEWAAALAETKGADAPASEIAPPIERNCSAT